ncbi:MAG: metal ABC transporter ATP-binding protein [Oscillospiraceae bacterium]|jgi:zinc transport system ATP-binding protein|nr:metal ABC transporter ATP-binding protein [Oscillospiraceae bacterium]
MPEVISADNVSFQYGDELVFSKISFAVGSGEFAAVIGANGAGKSTLLRMLLGELAPSSGAVRLFGRDVRDFRQWSRLGYLAQDGAAVGVNFPATAEEIVTANLFCEIGLMRFTKKRHRDKALRALERVGMGGYSNRTLGGMSGGQRQRVMLARALVGEPELLLLDEPTSGVDEGASDSIFALLSELGSERGLTVVAVTHDVAMASRYASRALCLEYGSLVELGREQLAEELTHRHRHARPGEIIPED